MLAPSVRLNLLVFSPNILRAKLAIIGGIDRFTSRKVPAESSWYPLVR
jgi:hypothetical protein